MANEQIQQWVHDALSDAKAQEIRALDVRRLTDVTDHMFIASGTSSTHVASIADKVMERLRGHGVKPLGIEGKDIAEWVLIDFGDVVVHVMRPQTRDFYNLEKLWSEEIWTEREEEQEAEVETLIRRHRVRK